MMQLWYIIKNKWNILKNKNNEKHISIINNITQIVKLQTNAGEIWTSGNSHWQECSVLQPLWRTLAGTNKNKRFLLRPCNLGVHSYPIKHLFTWEINHCGSKQPCLQLPGLGNIQDVSHQVGEPSVGQLYSEMLGWRKLKCTWESGKNQNIVVPTCHTTNIYERKF